MAFPNRGHSIRGGVCVLGELLCRRLGGQRSRFLRDVVSHFGPAALIVLEAAPKYQRLASPAVSFFLLVSNNRFCWQANA
jgi:hypothetical protein